MSPRFRVVGRTTDDRIRDWAATVVAAYRARVEAISTDHPFTISTEGAIPPMPRYRVIGEFLIDAPDATRAENIVQNAVERTPEHYETDTVDATPEDDDTPDPSPAAIPA